MSARLLLASHNAGKLREIEATLSSLSIEVISAVSLALPEPEETGATFHENAALKAHAAAEVSGLPALSDDSGLVIPALAGAPGIHSARWTGPKRDYAAAFARIRRELAAIGADDAAPAYFFCVLCLAFPGGDAHYFEGRVDGALTFPPRGAQGFGYDPVFIPEGHTRTFAEISADEKQALSHRGRALRALVEFLRRDPYVLEWKRTG